MSLQEYEKRFRALNSKLVSAEVMAEITGRREEVEAVYQEMHQLAARYLTAAIRSKAA